MKWYSTLQRNMVGFSIYFILFLIVGNGILDFYNRKVQESHEALMDRAMGLETKMNGMLNVLKNSDLGFRGFYILPNEQLLHPYTEAVETFPQNVTQVKQIMEIQGLDPARMKPVEQAYKDYFKLIDQMVTWRKRGNNAAIENEIARDPGFEVWQVYQGLKDEMDAEMKAIITASQATTDRIMFISTAIRFSLFALGIPTLLIVLIRLKRERKRRLELFRELDEHNRKYLFDAMSSSEMALDEKSIIDTLIINLRKASGFISNITKGNFEISWEGLNEQNKAANKENLAGELLQMREQMLKVKEEDKRRLWATEGESKFSELVRRNQVDIQLLADNITSEIVKYFGANQASLFFVENKGRENVFLKLYGCYAYDRKKFMEKTIEPGEGLVGQTFLEKEITYLTDIPQNYVRISSGLGEATPTSLIIVPLMINEAVDGILEIASFKEFRQHEFELLRKLGGILASAIVSLRSSVEMKSLMENLQSQSEEMKAQEEEMRQNMEELQATQEEMNRKAKEYQALVASKEHALTHKIKEAESLQRQLEELRN